jgi:hypothetical protein
VINLLTAAVTPSIEPNPTTALLPAQAELLEHLAVLLGTPPRDHHRLVAPQLINGPVGLVCRLHLQSGVAAVRPEVLLPLRADEFTGNALERLFTVQALLLDDLGWYLGMAPERMLSLTPLAWMTDADRIVTALDMANGIAVATVHALVDGEASTPQVRP